MAAPPPPGGPAPIHDMPEIVCAVSKLDGLLATLNGFREQLVHVEQLELAGLLDSPAVLMRDEIQRRVRAVLYQLEQWSAHE